MILLFQYRLTSYDSANFSLEVSSTQVQLSSSVMYAIQFVLPCIIVTSDFARLKFPGGGRVLPAGRSLKIRSSVVGL